MFKKSIFLIVIFISVSIFVSSSIYIIQNDYILIDTEKDFISDDVVSIKTKYNGKEAIDINNLKIEDDYMIARDDIGTYSGYGIYFNYEFKNNYNVLKGRFFEKEDFLKGEKLAVIGKGREEEIINKDNDEYILIAGEYYKVIGIIGDKKKKVSYDDNIYVNLDSLIREDNSYLTGSFNIDSNSKSKKVVEEIKSQIKDLEIYEADNNGDIYSYYNEEVLPSSIRFIVTILLTLILSTSIVTELWIKSRKKEIGIKRALGATKFRISINIIFDLLKISTISYIIGYLIYLSFTYFIYGYPHFYLISMIIVFGIITVSALLVSIVPIIKMNKMEPKEIMR